MTSSSRASASTTPPTTGWPHEVDRIVHPAALVNHVLSYEDMFAPNVAGTAELVALALHTRQKRFDFVSSIAAAALRRPQREATTSAPRCGRRSS